MRNIIGFSVSIMAMICILEAEGAPLLRLPLPFLRGGSATNATLVKTKALTAKKQRKQRKPGPHPIQILGANAKRGLGGLGNKIQQDTATLGKNIGREWGKITSNTQKFVANIPKPPLLPRRRKSLKSCKKLDEVCHNFASVLRGNEVDTAQLLKACKAHLAFMKTGGSSLRLVAKDLEANVQKAERVYKKSPKEGKSLSSLLACEKSRGIHHGDELHEKSAAMGLLWIRRSLKFQLDLYSSIISAEQHPREAAYGAYDKHLSPFHGWALRKVFPASLSQMPGRDVFIAKFAGISEEEMNDEYDREIARKLKALVSAWDPLISCWEEEFERLGLEDTRRV